MYFVGTKISLKGILRTLLWGKYSYVDKYIPYNLILILNHRDPSMGKQ